MREIPLAAIRARAYDIWERNHRPDGYEIQFWLLAERELRAEQESRRDAVGDETLPEAPGRGGLGQRTEAVGK